MRIEPQCLLGLKGQAVHALSHLLPSALPKGPVRPTVNHSRTRSVPGTSAFAKASANRWPPQCHHDGDGQVRRNRTSHPHADIPREFDLDRRQRGRSNSLAGWCHQNPCEPVRSRLKTLPPTIDQARLDISAPRHTPHHRAGLECCTHDIALLLLAPPSIADESSPRTATPSAQSRCELRCAAPYGRVTRTKANSAPNQPWPFDRLKVK